MNENGEVADYIKTITDLCYSYNKFAKENLHRNTFLSFTFICYAIQWLQQNHCPEKVETTLEASPDTIHLRERRVLIEFLHLIFLVSKVQ